MKSILTTSIIILFMLLNYSTFGQEQVQAAKIYSGGDYIFGSRTGISLEVPSSWSGFLDINTNYFLLNLDTVNDANMVLRAEFTNMQEIVNRWQDGTGPAMDLKLESKVMRLSDKKAAVQFSSTTDKTRKGYTVAICGEYGVCATIIMTADRKNYENVERAVNEFARRLVFSDPTLSGAYADFNWRSYLSDKYLFNFESSAKSRKQNELWLCVDLSFKANLTRKGIMKGTIGKYEGKKKGIYRITGVGPRGKLKLNFKKLDPVEIELEIRDDIIYLNGERFAVGQNPDCKK